MTPPSPWLESARAAWARFHYQGWLSSLALHALLLLAMAFWYFNPPADHSTRIDAGLLGSDSGVEDALFPTGGLNAPLEMLKAEERPPEPLMEWTPTPALRPNPKRARARAEPNRSEADAAGGGLETRNPGAGQGDGFGLARFGDGSEEVQGVSVKVGDPQFTLIWDSEADLDLHVIEPGGKEISWEHTQGDRGGELDRDNAKGYGPENVYWLHEDPVTGVKTKGQGPPGNYRWFVVFWGGIDGKIRPTNWKVRVKHAGKVEVYSGHFRALDERSKERVLKVAPPPTP